MPKALIVAIGVAVVGIGGYVGFRTLHHHPAHTASTAAVGSLAFADQTVSGTVLCKIGGMQGGCCKVPVQSALLRIEGVEKVETDVKTGTAQVTIKEGRSIQTAQLAKTFEGSMYYIASVEPLKVN